MTKLLEQALANIAQLSEKEQDAFATELLERFAAKEALDVRQTVGDLQDEPFFGIWRDCEGMTDSSTWVRTLRKREWPEHRQSHPY